MKTERMAIIIVTIVTTMAIIGGIAIFSDDSSDADPIPLDNTDYTFDRTFVNKMIHSASFFGRYDVTQDISFGSAYLKDDWVVESTTGCTATVEIENTGDWHDVKIYVITDSYTTNIALTVSGHTAYSDIFGEHIVDKLTYNFSGTVDEVAINFVFDPTTLGVEYHVIDYTEGYEHPSDYYSENPAITVGRGWYYNTIETTTRITINIYQPDLFAVASEDDDYGNGYKLIIDKVDLPSGYAIDRVDPDRGTIAGGETVTTYLTHGTYTIQLNPGIGGTVTPTRINFQPDTDYVDIPEATRDGYTNVSWHSSTITDISIGRLYNPFDVFGGSVTLYADWEAETITITLDPGIGGSVTPTTITRSYEQMFGDLPTPTRGEDAFLGWYTAAEGGDLITRTTIIRTTHDFTIFAHWRNHVILTLDANGGEVVPNYVEGMEGDLVTLPTPTYSGHVFTWWYTSKTGGTPLPVDSSNKYELVSSMTVYAHYEGSVYWTNGYNNSIIETLYHYDNVGQNFTHQSKMSLQNSFTYQDTDKTTKTVFTDSGYYIVIQVDYAPTNIKATLYDPDDNVVKTNRITNYGHHASFTIKVNAYEGKVEIGMVANFDTFQSYTVTNYQTVLDWSDLPSILYKSVSTVEMEDIEDDEHHVRFQVVYTQVFLETYGVVMIDPSINIQTLFPNYDNVRLNFFSFAIRGDGFTVNDHRMEIKDGFVKIYYIMVDKVARWAEPGTEGALEKEIDFRNVYVTWLDGKIYLGFGNDTFYVDMTDYISTETEEGDQETPLTPSRVVSFDGIWYFTTGLFEPYKEMEKTWTIDWFAAGFDLNALCLVFAGICILGTAFCIHRYGFNWYDLVIIAGAVAVAITCIAV